MAQFETIKTLKEKYDLDIWSDFRHEGDFVDFMVSPTLQPVIEKTMRHFSIAYETFIEDVEAAARAQLGLLPTSVKPDIETEYLTLEQIEQWMTDFASDNSIVSVESAEETSYEGRPINYLKISASGNAERSFFMTCGIHAREWVSPAACMNIATMYIDGYANKDATITALLSNLDIYIVPVSNPDGYVYTWTDDRMWRKTRSTAANNGCTMNCDGVDPNRNYDSAWSGAGSSSNCCSDSFYGPAPFSETETLAQSNLVQTIGNVKGYIDIHAYSQMWMIPYGYTTNLCADYAYLDELASDSVAAIKAIHGKTYTSGPISDVIYVASGSSADYFYDERNVKCSFAAELRDTGLFGFTLPANQILPTAQETFAGLNVIAQAIVDGECDH